MSRASAAGAFIFLGWAIVNAQTTIPGGDSVSTIPSVDEQNPAQEALPNPIEDRRDRIYYPGDTESIRPLAAKLGGNILLDQKEIWTSPFHMKKSDAKWWIGFGAVAGALIATDRDTAPVFQNNPTQLRWANRVSQVGAAYTLVPLVAGFYGYGAIGHDAQAREVGVLGAEALIDSLIVVSVLKPIGGRVRPDATHGERSRFFDGGDSFPSGHAIETWALASVIAHEYKRGGGRFVPFLAYGLATAVSGARFAAQRHYASDIVVGAGMGWFIGRYVYQTHQDHSSHRHAWTRPAIIPTVDPGTRSYVVALRLGS